MVKFKYRIVFTANPEHSGSYSWLSVRTFTEYKDAEEYAKLLIHEDERESYAIMQDILLPCEVEELS